MLSLIHLHTLHIYISLLSHEEHCMGLCGRQKLKEVKHNTKVQTHHESGRVQRLAWPLPCTRIRNQLLLLFFFPFHFLLILFLFNYFCMAQNWDWSWQYFNVVGSWLKTSIDREVNYASITMVRASYKYSILYRKWSTNNACMHGLREKKIFKVNPSLISQKLVIIRNKGFGCC